MDALGAAASGSGAELLSGTTFAHTHSLGDEELTGPPTPGGI